MTQKTQKDTIYFWNFNKDTLYVIDTCGQSNLKYQYLKEECPCWMTWSNTLISNIIWPITILLVLLLYRNRINGLLGTIQHKLYNAGDIKIGQFMLSQSGEVTKPSENSVNSDSADSTPQNANLISSEMEQFLGNNMVKKILSTLWFNQLKYDNSFRTRWTFFIKGDSEFDQSIDQLQWKGLVALAQKIDQFYLTDQGIELCKNISSQKLDSQLSYF